MGPVPSMPARRLLSGLLGLALVGGAVACTGGTEEPAGERRTPAAERPAPPTPSERLGLEPGWGPTRAELDTAARQVGRLSLPDLAGQVIVASWSGTEAPTRLVRDLHLGGVIAFDDNVVDAAQVGRLTHTLQREARRPWPVLVGVDQEGGIVERIEDGVTRFPAFMSTGAADDPALTRRVYDASGSQLRALGFNVDFAPDADVTIGPTDPVIGSRSAGGDAQLVATQSVAAARGYRDAGLVPVLKHFPGHGSVTVDSHVGLPVQGRSLRELRESDLVPFEAGVEAGLPAVMVGHLVVSAVDDRVPATVSRPVISGLLREDLGFEGLVVSDALDMAAISQVPAPAVGFLRAGGDTVLMPPDPAATRGAIVAAVRAGDLPRRRLEQAAARLVALLEHTATQRPGRPDLGPEDASRRLSDAAVTVATGPCSGRLVSEPLVPFGEAGTVAAFRAAAVAGGLPLGSITYDKPPRPRLTGRKKVDEQRLEQWRGIAPTAVVNGTPIRFDDVDGPAGVLVATGTPYLLGYAAAPVEIATFGTTPASMAALVEVLLGHDRAPGRLPVAVSGVQRRGC